MTVFSMTAAVLARAWVRVFMLSDMTAAAAVGGFGSGFGGELGFQFGVHWEKVAHGGELKTWEKKERGK